MFVNEIIIFSYQCCNISCDVFLCSLLILVTLTGNKKLKVDEYRALYLRLVTVSFFYHIGNLFLRSKPPSPIETLLPIILMSTGLSGIFILSFFFYEKFFHGNLNKLIMFLLLISFLLFWFRRWNLFLEENLVVFHFNFVLKRIRKILHEEIPLYIYSSIITFAEECKFNEFKFFLLVLGVIFLVNTFLVFILKEHLIGNLKNIETFSALSSTRVEYAKNVLYILFMFKILCELNDSLFFYMIFLHVDGNNEQKYSHLPFLFTLQFLFKLGYYRIKCQNFLLKFFVVKIIILTTSVLLLINKEMLQHELASYLVFIFCGVSNQIIFATFDYYFSDFYSAYLAEFIVFVIFSLYIYFFATNNMDSLSKLVFFSNVRL